MRNNALIRNSSPEREKTFFSVPACRLHVLNVLLGVFEFVLLGDGDVASARLEVVCETLSVGDMIHRERITLRN